MAALAVSLTLYDHIHELLELLEEAENAPPETRADYDAVIREQVIGTKDKVDRVNATLSQVDQLVQHATEEIERLQARKAAALRKGDRLKGYVRDVMQVAGLKKLEGHTSGFTLRINAPSVEVLDDTAIPSEFVVVRQVSAPDKQSIKAAFARGVDVPGARLIQTTTVLRR